MNQEISESPRHDPLTRPRRHGFWFGLFVGGLAGIVLGGVVVTTAKVSASPLRWMSSAHGHMGHGRFAGLQNPELAKEHAAFAAEWVLSRVDATPEQKEQVNLVLGNAIDSLVPLAEQHRGNRRAFVSELTRPEIDRATIEGIREVELTLMDQASRTLVKSFADVAEVLTPEQRAELAEMAERFHQ